MDTRLAMHELEAEHRLDVPASRRLAALAGLNAEPAATKRVLPLGLAALGAVLVGMGLVFWIAANWDVLGRFGRFALLQGVVVVMGVAAIARMQMRPALGVLMFLATGALFAYFGQTYQTGADPWQLFAIWAALTLPLALALRTDLVWAPWVLVAFVGISLWIHAHSGQRWWNNEADTAVHLAAWAAVGLLVAGVSSHGRHFTGAGVWSLRTAVTLAVVLVTSTAMVGVLTKHVAATYPLGLIVLGALAVAFAPARRFDVYAVSASALGLVTLLVVGMGRVLFEGARGDPIGSIFMIGVVAAALLAAAVSMVLRLSREHAAHVEGRA